MKKFKDILSNVQGLNETAGAMGKTHETESGTAKITKTHVHFDNSGYKQKFSHKEIAHMDKGGTVRGFKHEKDNPYHDSNNHVYSNGDEEHHLPTKHKLPVKESLDEVIDYAEIKKHLKKTGKGGSVSYKHNDGSKKTGTYGGLMNRGGRSYAKVHHTGPGGGMSIVPLPNIHHK